MYWYILITQLYLMKINYFIHHILKHIVFVQ